MPAVTYQAGGVLLDEHATARTGMNAEQLASNLEAPCAALRSAFMGIDIQSVAVDAKRGRTPYPVVEHTGDSYVDWGHLDYRLRANMINEHIEECAGSMRKAIEWYSEVQKGGANASSLYVQTSLPVLSRVVPAIEYDTEVMPKVLDVGEHLPSVAYPYVKVSMMNSEVHNKWNTTMTPHTGMILFVSDRDSGHHYIFPGYTLPKPDEKAKGDEDGGDGEAGVVEGDGEEDKIQSLEEEKVAEMQKLAEQASDIRIKLSTTFYWTSWDMSTIGKMEGGADQVLGYLGIARKLGRGSQQTGRLARIETLLFKELSLALMSKLNPRQRNVLLNPLQCVDVKPLSEWKAMLHANDIYEELETACDPLTLVRMSPQQLRYAVEFIRFVAHTVMGTHHSYPLLPLGGPPGTGKTATIMQALLLLSDENVLGAILEILCRRKLLRMNHFTLFELTRALQSQRMVFVAPTNDAVDEGIAYLSDAISKLSSERDGASTMSAIRFSQFEKAQGKPHLLKLHSTYAAAAYKMEEWREQERVYAERLDQSETLKQKIKQCRAALRKDEMSDDQRIGLENEIQELESEKSELNKNANQGTQATQARKYLMETTGRFLNDPAVFGNVDLTKPREELPKSVLATYRKALKKVLFRAGAVVFMTCGFANPYQPLAVDLLEDSIAIMDEGSMGQYEDILKLIRGGKGLVVCGDVNQLPPVIKAKEEATVDLRYTLMEKLRAATLWLTLCFRVPPAGTAFSGATTYQGTGLYSPVGQNVIRCSRMHALSLFHPGVLLNVEGYAVSSRGSTSKRNVAEAEAVREYLRAYTITAAKLLQKPITVRIVTPYADQAALLNRMCMPFACSPAFESIDIGTIETCQGATTDLCIVSICAAPEWEEGVARIGFLTKNRLNVAITRHRLNLVVACNVTAIKQLQITPENSFLRQLLASSVLQEISLGKDPATFREKLEERASATNVSGPMLLSHVEPCSAPAEENHWLDAGQPVGAMQMAEIVSKAGKEILDGHAYMENADMPTAL